MAPSFPEALNNLAWIRATESQAELRDGAEAVRLAEQACQLSSYHEPSVVGTLAAAYAEAGRFDEAVAMAAKARDLALAAGKQDLAEVEGRLLEHFKARQAWRDSNAAAK